MKLKLVKGVEICRCGGEYSGIHNGLRCLHCRRIMYKGQEKRSVKMPDHSFSQVRECPKCSRSKFEPKQFVSCEGNQCSVIRPYPLNNQVCKKCGNGCLKSLGERFFHYCPVCDYEVLILIHESGIPPDIIKKKLTDLRPNEFNGPLFDYIRQIHKSPNPIKSWIVLKGPTGSGKTTFGSVIAKRLMQRLLPVKFLHLPTYLETCRSMIDFKNEDAPELRLQQRQYFDVKVLFLDDLYTKDFTPFQRKRIYDIIWHRDAHDLPTIITTQHSYRELSNALDETTASRIKGRSTWFVPGDEDMRKQPD